MTSQKFASLLKTRYVISKKKTIQTDRHRRFTYFFFVVCCELLKTNGNKMPIYRWPNSDPFTLKGQTKKKKEKRIIIRRRRSKRRRRTKAAMTTKKASKQAHRETNKQTNKKTNKQANKQNEKQIKPTTGSPLCRKNNHICQTCLPSKVTLAQVLYSIRCTNRPS